MGLTATSSAARGGHMWLMGPGQLSRLQTRNSSPSQACTRTTCRFLHETGEETVPASSIKTLIRFQGPKLLAPSAGTRHRGTAS